MDVVTSPADRRRRLDGTRKTNAVVTDPLGVFHHHNSVRPRRHRRAGHYSDGFTGPNRSIGSRAGGNLSDHFEINGYR